MQAEAYASEAVNRPNANAEYTPCGRSRAVAQLAGVLGSLAAAGDIEGARHIHESIGHLLGSIANRNEGAMVVSLEAERQRRAGR